MAEPAHATLAALDQLLADQPARVMQHFSDALQRLTAYRERLIAEVRDTQGGSAGAHRLSRLNAVISVVYSTQFSVGAPRWLALQQARTELAALAAEMPV